MVSNFSGNRSYMWSKFQKIPPSAHRIFCQRTKNFYENNFYVVREKKECKKTYRWSWFSGFSPITPKSLRTTLPLLGNSWWSSFTGRSSLSLISFVSFWSWNGRGGSRSGTWRSGSGLVSACSGRSWGSGGSGYSCLSDYGYVGISSCSFDTFLSFQTLDWRKNTI